jgi:hypothetical protein
MYPIVKFTCRLTSSFHTSEFNYSNLYTCAPYILGSTLRGAALRCLIDEYCTRLDDLHQDGNNPDFHHVCLEDCDIKPLFCPPTRFSFGSFQEDNRAGESNRTVYTRVGISRDRQSAAQGALVSVEVQRGDFTFQVMCLNTEMVCLVKKGVRWAGSRKDVGIGRFRSIGWGQFDVLCCEYIRPEMPQAAKSYDFVFQTPYVMPEEAARGEIRKEILELHLRNSLPDGHSFPPIDIFEPMISSLSYVRRWSDERGHKENRLVADKGSRFRVTFLEEVNPECVYLWQWGIGDWYEYGFGSFTAEPE